MSYVNGDECERSGDTVGDVQVTTEDLFLHLGDHNSTLVNRKTLLTRFSFLQSEPTKPKCAPPRQILITQATSADFAGAS